MKSLRREEGQVIRRFLQEDLGATMVEYALVVVLIAGVAVVGVNAFGLSVKDLWQYCADTAVNAIGG